MKAKERKKPNVRRMSVIVAERLVVMALILAAVSIFVRHRTLVDQALRYLVAALR